MLNLLKDHKLLYHTVLKWKSSMNKENTLFGNVIYYSLGYGPAHEDVNGVSVTKKGKSKACMSINHSTFFCSKRYYQTQIYLNFNTKYIEKIFSKLILQCWQTWYSWKMLELHFIAFLLLQSRGPGPIYCWNFN